MSAPNFIHVIQTHGCEREEWEKKIPFEWWMALSLDLQKHKDDRRFPIPYQTNVKYTFVITVLTPAIDTKKTERGL